MWAVTGAQVARREESVGAKRAGGSGVAGGRGGSSNWTRGDHSEAPDMVHARKRTAKTKPAENFRKSVRQ
jgi:hypothetical protein